MTTTQTHGTEKPVVVTVRITADLHRQLSQAAHERGQSQSLMIAEAIEARLTSLAHEHMDDLTADYDEKMRRHQEFIRLTGGSKIG